jgi:hypothetical protein
MAQYKSEPIPRPLTLSATVTKLIDISSVKSEEEARFLFEQAILSIYQDNGFAMNAVLRHNIDSGFALIRSIDPQDDVEKVYTAQIVLGQILGMHKLSQPYKTDQRIGIQLLKLSNESMQRICEKRHGSQDINTR